MKTAKKYSVIQLKERTNLIAWGEPANGGLRPQIQCQVGTKVRLYTSKRPDGTYYVVAVRRNRKFWSNAKFKCNDGRIFRCTLADQLHFHSLLK